MELAGADAYVSGRAMLDEVGLGHEDDLEGRRGLLIPATMREMDDALAASLRQRQARADEHHLAPSDVPVSAPGIVFPSQARGYAGLRRLPLTWSVTDTPIWNAIFAVGGQLAPMVRCSGRLGLPHRATTRPSPPHTVRRTCSEPLALTHPDRHGRSAPLSPSGSRTCAGLVPPLWAPRWGSVSPTPSPRRRCGGASRSRCSPTTSSAGGFSRPSASQHGIWCRWRTSGRPRAGNCRYWRALIGLGYGWIAQQSGSLRVVSPAHALTDSCGVRQAHTT